MREWLAARVRASPEATALIDADSGRRSSYAAVDERVERLAAGLAEAGVRSGDHVGAVLGVGPAAISVVHAVMRCGAVLVPFSPRLTADELAERARRGDCELLVCEPETEAATRDAGRATGSDETIAVRGIETLDRAGTASDDGSRAVGSAERNSPNEEWTMADPLVVLFTSGTTGQPKGVVLTAGNVAASAGASATRLGALPSDRWLLTLSIGGMGGLAPIYRSVLYGSALVLQRAFDARATVEALSQYDCTGVSLVPTMLDRMCDTVADERANTDGENRASRKPALSESLRFVLLGGAPASKTLIERCRNYGIPVYPTYGMTETASQVATARPAEAFEHPGTVGRPLFGTTIRAIAGGRTLDPGERGELVVSGPVVTPGYYGRQREQSPFDENGFHTGDLGYVDSDGRVWVTGRLDDRIVTGGETVDPEEVRETLRAHPGVREAAVVGLADEEWGERVGALVVADPDGPTIDEAALEAHCRERLAGYKLPRTIAFAGSLPRTGSGTIDRVAVSEGLRDPTGSGAR